jgi:tetratricopeptide (TPR) repeat protein
MAPASPQPADNPLQQALRLHQAGQLDEAAAIYRRILAANPRHPDALHLLGLVALQRGDRAAALERIDAAIAISGGVAEYHHNRGVALLRLGRQGEAEPSFRRALQLKPAYPEAHNALGNALLALQRLDEAVTAYRSALTQQSPFPEAHNNLGNALRRLNKLDEAIAHYWQAVQQRPGYLKALCSLAAALQERGNLVEAEACYRSAVTQHPEQAKAWHGLAVVQRELGDFEAAVASLRRAVAAGPEDLHARLDLGDWLADLGRADEARDCFHEVLRRSPTASDAEVGLARLARFGGDAAAADTHLAAALRITPDSVSALCAAMDHEGETIDADLRSRTERLAEDERQPPRDRSRLHLALAGLLDRTGAYENAFWHLQRGNDLRRADLESMGKGFEASVHAAFVDRQIATFTPELFGRSADFGNPSELPVFIVGMPRSGTTLCEQILASHPQVRGLGELQDVKTMARVLPERLAANGGRPLPYPECMRALDAAVTGPLVDAYLARIHGLAAGAARVTDKHPTNFRHLGLIATLLPRARVIHCRRDAMDTCFSCFKQDFDSPIPWAVALDAVGQYYRQYARLMRHWRSVLPVAPLEFVYEEAIQDLEGVARRLLAFCGLPWDARCLHFHETERPVLTASRWQVRQPLYAGSVGKWRRYERHLGPLKAALGELAAG